MNGAPTCSPADLPLEDPICVLCDSADRRVLYAAASFEPYRVVRCQACDFVYLCPRPTEAAMRALYESGGYYEQDGDSGYVSYADQETALRLTFRNALGTLARRGLTGGTLLEVGCGFGFLLDEAGPYFDRREGTEMARTAVQAAEKCADQIYPGGIDAVPRDASYDMVLSSQVIEHLHRPLEFLTSQRARLRRGGSLVVATPKMGSLWQRALGARWPSFKLPEHLLYFDASSLARLLRQAGLVDITVLPWPHAFPLALVASKLGIQIPKRIGRRSIWLPGTTLAMSGRLP